MLNYRATDIGARVWQANVLGPLEVVTLDQFMGHFVLASLTIQEEDLWITIAYDHVRCSSAVGVTNLNLMQECTELDVPWNEDESNT